MDAAGPVVLAGRLMNNVPAAVPTVIEYNADIRKPFNRCSIMTETRAAEFPACRVPAAAMRNINAAFGSSDARMECGNLCGSALCAGWQPRRCGAEFAGEFSQRPPWNGSKAST